MEQRVWVCWLRQQSEGVVISYRIAKLCQDWQNRLVYIREATLIFSPRQKFSDSPSTVCFLLLLLEVSLPAEHVEMGFPKCHGFAHIPKFQQGSAALTLTLHEFFLWQTTVPAPSTGGKARKESVLLLPKSHFENFLKPLQLFISFLKLKTVLNYTWNQAALKGDNSNLSIILFIDC